MSADLEKQLAAERERADYAWRNTHTIEAARAEEMRRRDAAEAEIAELRAALYDEHHGITHALRVALFEEAIESILNLAPGVRKDRGGCFGDRQADCGCTVCKIRRWLAIETATRGASTVDSPLDPLRQAA